MLRPPPTSTLFPYTTLFRSRLFAQELREQHHRLRLPLDVVAVGGGRYHVVVEGAARRHDLLEQVPGVVAQRDLDRAVGEVDRKSTRLNSSHVSISYAVFCLK